MPRTINADGRTITVPDDATPEEINEIVGPPAPPAKSFWDRVEEVRPVGVESGKGAVASFLDTTFGNIGGSIISAAHHPIQTVKGALETTGAFMEPITPGVPPEMRAKAKETRGQFLKQPGESWGDYTGRMEGQAYAMLPFIAVDEAARGTETAETKGLPAPRAKGAVKDLIKKVRAGNEAADAYSTVRASIETARENALKIGNEKYSAVNEALSGTEADPVTINRAIAGASENLRGSTQDTTLLKNMETEYKEHPPSYSDLQADYSRLGKELVKGTLPADVFHAYDQLHEVVGNEMQRIADSEGQGPALTAARNYWRRMKQTFGKPWGATDAATGALRSVSPDLAEQDAINNRVRLLGSFDPDIPKQFDRLQKAQEASKGAPKPAPGEIGTIGAQDIQKAKAESLRKGAEYVRRRALTIATFVTGYRALATVSRAMMGDTAALATLPADVAEGVGVMVGMHGLANFLESPKIMKMLTEPTGRDVASIPPDLRSSLVPIVEQAQKQGIKVSPRILAVIRSSTAITAATGAATPKGPAPRATQSVPLPFPAPRQNPSDEWSSPQQ